MAQNPRFNNSGMFTNIDSNDYSEITPDNKSEVLATQGNVINSIKVFWNKLKAKLAYAVTRPDYSKAVGGHYQPVYIDEHGVVQVCAPETINATIENGNKINIGDTPIYPGKTICVQLHGSLSASALPLKIGTAPIIYPSGAPVYSTNVNSEGTYLLTYMAGGGNKWILISSMNIVDGTNNGLMTADEHNKLNGIQEGANNYSLPAATDSSLGGVQLGYTENGQNYKIQKDNNNNLFVNVPWTDTDTHHTALLKVGGTNSKENQITTNGNTYLQIVEANRVTSQRLIKGTKGVTVTSDSNGNITVEGTDTKYPGLWTDEDNNFNDINTQYTVYGPGSSKANTSNYLRGDGSWGAPAASMGSMSVEYNGSAIQTRGGCVSATIIVKYNGVGINYMLLGPSGNIISNNGTGSAPLGDTQGFKYGTITTVNSCGIIIPIGNLSLKPQIIHFYSTDRVDIL